MTKEQLQDLRYKLKCALYMIGSEKRVNEVDSLDEETLKTWFELARNIYQAKQEAGVWRA